MTHPTRAGQALLDSFESIRIINLLERRDRRREMAEQLRRLGLSFVHPRIALFEARRFSDPAGFPTPGTRGCFESHHDLLRDAGEQGLDSILILEDDLNFHDEIDTLLPRALESLGASDWDIFYGSVMFGQFEESTSPIELLSPELGLTGTHFYAIRGSAIATSAAYLEQMLDRQFGDDHPDGHSMHVDGALSVFRRRHPDYQTYMALPDLGYQRLSRTDVHALPVYDRVLGLRTCSSLVRSALKASGRTGRLRRDT